MKLFISTQDTNRGYDTYDSLVVCAENEEEARCMSPSHYVWDKEVEAWYFLKTDGSKTRQFSTARADHVKDVKVKYLGEASQEVTKLGQHVILASFNAG
jgi:hypothetical protein